VRARSEWNARNARRRIPFDARRLKGTCIHYAGYHIRTEPQLTLRNIQRYHLDTKGWYDIAYNAAVGLDGSVWELRGLDIENGAQGGRRLNRAYVAVVALLGPDQDPTEGMIEGLQEAVRLVRAKYPDATSLVGHRDLKATSCPGDALAGMIDSGALEPPLSEQPERHSEALPGYPKPLRVGDEGTAVARLQRALGVQQDGKFGPQTQGRLMQLQTAFDPHLGPPNGIAGLETWRWLLWVETL